MRVQILMYYRHIEYAVLMGEYTTMSTHSLSEHHSTDETFRTILRPVKNGVNLLVKKSRISVL